jgi:GMP synthase (glutamine-hydrolysing)
VPDSFDAFVGHKEALSVPPPHATVLASSATCPIQLFKVGQNVYATQFHPELDVPGIVRRMQTYRHEGYFDPDELDALIAEVSQADVRSASVVLKNFVDTYAKSE